MSIALNFLQSEHVLAFLTATLVFLTTIFLVVKRWIGFSVTLLLLIFSLAAGLIINYQQDLQNYFFSSSSNPPISESPEDFHKHMIQAMEDLRIEIATEKEKLWHVMNQVQEIFESMEIQKQKLQNFIEETREQFIKNDYQKKSSSNILESHSNQISSDQNETSSPS